jgi:hypothetical protein
MPFALSHHHYRRLLLATKFSSSNRRSYNHTTSIHVKPISTTTMATIKEEIEDPSKVLPRDLSGSYLHLKLKRYAKMEDLTMNYAKTTWKTFPQDAQADLSPTSQSSCRQCHDTIDKGDVRLRLYLQCHKGCKTAAFFHESCFWNYPETKKLERVEEIVGLEDLPDKNRKQVLQHFQAFHDSNKNTPSAIKELELKEGENDIKQSKPRKRRKKDF